MKKIYIKRGNSKLTQEQCNSIARLIYKTDRYIYPFWFDNNILEAEKVLSSLIKEKDSIFYFKNFLLAYNESNDIIGILLHSEPSKDYSFHYIDYKKHSENSEYVINKYVLNCIHDTSYVNIICLCVTEKERIQGVATALFNKLFSLYKKTNQMFCLECLTDNHGALRIYKKLGFEIVDTVEGFKNISESCPVYLMKADNSKKRL